MCARVVFHRSTFLPTRPRDAATGKRRRRQQRRRPLREKCIQRDEMLISSCSHARTSFLSSHSTNNNDLVKVFNYYLLGCRTS